MKLFKNKKDDLIDYIDSLLFAKSEQLKIKQHAIQHAVDLIAKTISKSEIKIYRRDKSDRKIKSVKNQEYYLLNIRPNDNEEATSFFYNVIQKYLLEEDALIVNFNNKLYLADNYNSTESILFPKKYYNVRVSDYDGNTLIFDKEFDVEDVIRLNLKCSHIKETLDDYYCELGKMIGVACSRYKITNSFKFRLKHLGNQLPLKDFKTGKEITYEEYKDRITKGLFSEDDAVILLSENFDLEKIDLGNETTISEWEKLEKKWSDKVAMSFNIPLDIFYGNKTDKSTSTSDFLTFGVIPHLQVIEDSLNSKLINKEEYLQGEFIKINRFNMLHKDILEASTPMDKLFSNGFSRNEINDIVGLPKIDEKWADEHHITKNYENTNLTTEGGDEE